MIENGPSFFTALVTLNLLEVSPKPSHLPFIVMAGTTWLKTYPDSVPLWIDNGTGRRICCLIDNIRLKEPALLRRQQKLRDDLDLLLAGLVRIGVADAARLEQALLAEPRLPRDHHKLTDLRRPVKPTQFSVGPLTPIARTLNRSATVSICATPLAHPC